MAIATFPSFKTHIKTLSKIPKFSTVIVKYGNKVEQRISKDSSARYRFVLSFVDAIPDINLEEIMLFFINRKGSYEAFYFQNPEEAYRGIKWKVATAYVVGNIVRPITANGRSYKCTVAGTSGGSEPTWPVTVGGTIGDNSVTWKENTYLTRFESDLINAEYFQYSLYDLKEISLIEVSA